MTIKETPRLTQGSVVALDGLAGEPLLDILINGYLIACGEVVVVAINTAYVSMGYYYAIRSVCVV